MLNLLMQSLPKMSAGYVRPLSPMFIGDVLEPDLVDDCIENVDANSRLKTLGQAIRLALRARRWGNKLSHEQCIQLNWWLRLSEVGFPEHCSFDCVAWDNGCGFECDHRSWRASSYLSYWRSTIYLPGSPYYENVYDDLQELAFVLMAPPIETVPYVAPARPGINVVLAEGTFEACDADCVLYARMDEEDPADWIVTDPLLLSYFEYGNHDSFGEHPHEHPKANRLHFHGKCTKVRRQGYKWYEASLKKRTAARHMRRKAAFDQQALELWELGVRGDHLDKHLETPGPINNENIVNGRTFEEIEDDEFARDNPPLYDADGKLNACYHDQFSYVDEDALYDKWEDMFPEDLWIYEPEYWEDKLTEFFGEPDYWYDEVLAMRCLVHIDEHYAEWACGHCGHYHCTCEPATPQTASAV